MARLDLALDEVAHRLAILLARAREANQQFAKLLVLQPLRPLVVLQVVDEERVGIVHRDLAVVAALAADAFQHRSSLLLRRRGGGEQREGQGQHGRTSYSSGGRAGNAQREPEAAAAARLALDAGFAAVRTDDL